MNGAVEVQRTFFSGLVLWLLAVTLPQAATAQTREATLATLSKLQGSERQTRLIEGARKESGLVWYSSTTAEDALALIKKFHEQHPAIQVQHFRSASEKLLERILAESRAGAVPAGNKRSGWILDGLVHFGLGPGL